MQSIRIAFMVTAVLSGSLHAEQSASPTATPQSKTGPSSTSTRPLREEVSRLMKAHAAADSLSDEVAHVLPLIEVTRKIADDPRFATSPTLQSLRGHVFARLRRVKRETHSLVRRQKKRPKEIHIESNVLAQLNQAANPNGANANNAVVAADFGPQLIDLIQRTISPKSWDVNGGSSTVQYWRPGMALVVRAPQAVHREMNPLLRQLRK